MLDKFRPIPCKPEKNHCAAGARWLLTLVLLTGILLSGCGDDAPEAPPAQAPQALPVQTMTLTPQTWRSSFDSYGYLESTETVNISIDFSGTVREVNFKDGQTIRAGQVLIELDRRKQEFKLIQAEASVESALAALEQSRSTFHRHRDLVTTGALSQEQFKQSEASFERASATLNEAEAALSLVQQELRETTIISPVDGIVDARNVEPGQTVLPGNLLAVVEVTDTLRAVTYVGQREVNLLRLGEAAPMSSPGVPGREYQARVELVGNSADPRTGNFVVKLTVNNKDHRLRAGMSVRLQLKGAQRENVLLIPQRALVDRNRRRVAYRLIDGRAQEVEPSIGVSNDHQVPVYMGFNPGDELILAPLELLQNGKLVVAENPEPELKPDTENSDALPAPALPSTPPAADTNIDVKADAKPGSDEQTAATTEANAQ